MSWITGARVKVIDDPQRDHVNIGYKGTIVEVHRNGTWISVALDVNKRSEEKYLQFKKRWLALLPKDRWANKHSKRNSSTKWEPYSSSRDVLPAPEEKIRDVRDERGSFGDRLPSFRERSSHGDRIPSSRDKLPTLSDRKPFSRDRLPGWRDRVNISKDRKCVSRDKIFLPEDSDHYSRDRSPLSRDKVRSSRDRVSSSRDKVASQWDIARSSRSRIDITKDRHRDMPLSSKDIGLLSKELPAPNDRRTAFRDRPVSSPREKLPSAKASKFGGWFGKRKPTVTKANPKSTVRFVCPVDKFTVHDVTIWLDDVGWGDYIECFFLAEIDGKSLQRLNNRSLMKLKVLPQHRPKMMADINRLISAPVGMPDERKTDTSDIDSPAISLNSARTDRTQRSERSSAVGYFESNPYTSARARGRGPSSDRSHSSVPESIAASINSSYSIASSIAELESLRDISRRKQRDKERRTYANRSNRFKE